jgi:RNA polymerase sigma-70 factor (ECF subfamily)
MGRGDVVPAEIERLYKERFRAFLLPVTAMLGDGEAALDVVQEAFALALRRRRTFRGEGTLEAWVWRIVMNSARDWLRANRVRSSDLLREQEMTMPLEPDELIRQLLLALPERQRLTVFLRYYADLSYDQIAEALGVQSGTVAASLNAAHTSLRRRLAEAQ